MSPHISLATGNARHVAARVFVAGDVRRQPKLGVRDFVCPACGALSGERCKRASDGQPFTGGNEHVNRRRLAVRARNNRLASRPEAPVEVVKRAYGGQLQTHAVAGPGLAMCGWSFNDDGARAKGSVRDGAWTDVTCRACEAASIS